MNPVDLVLRVEACGGVLMLNGDRLRYGLPQEATALVEPLKQHRDEVVRILRQREKGVLRWLREFCAVANRGSANAQSLYRQYAAWSAHAVTYEAFLGVLAKRNWTTDECGMVAGLVLGADFAAACEYERLV